MKSVFKNFAKNLAGKKSIPEIEIATFHHAVAKLDYETLKSLIQTYGSDIVNSKYHFRGKKRVLPNYSTPLFGAVNFLKEGRHLAGDGTTRIISAGPQMDHTSVSLDQRTTMIKFLLDNGADPNQEIKYLSLVVYIDGSSGGRLARTMTSLEHMLHVRGMESIVQLLLERGAKLPKDAASIAATEEIRNVIRRYLKGDLPPSSPPSPPGRTRIGTPL